MFNNKTKTVQKIRKNIITAKQLRIGRRKGFVLGNKKTIIDEGENGNWEIEIFKSFFQDVNERRKI